MGVQPTTHLFYKRLPAVRHELKIDEASELDNVEVGREERFVSKLHINRLTCSPAREPVARQLDSTIQLRVQLTTKTTSTTRSNALSTSVAGGDFVWGVVALSHTRRSASPARSHQQTDSVGRNSVLTRAIQ